MTDNRQPVDVIVVGAGKWAHECWAPLLRESTRRYRVLGVADPDLARARSLAAALEAPDGDGDAAREVTAVGRVADAVSALPAATAVIVLAAPDRHADCITELAAAGLHVLTEKPLVTTAADATRVAAAVARAGVKLAVIQNYRYQARIQLARDLVAGGALGPVRYVVARFAADYRRPGSWDVGDAHTMPDPLLVEGAIHHLDMIRYLTGRDITAVTAATLDPDGSSFAGNAVAGLLLHLDGGTFALYEGTLLAAGTENRWRDEHYRIELAHGSITCRGPKVTVTRDGVAEDIDAADADMFSGHRVQLAAFADWVRGGCEVETTLTDNLRSLAGLFAAIDSARTGTTVPVPLLG